MKNIIVVLNVLSQSRVRVRQEWGQRRAIVCRVGQQGQGQCGPESSQDKGPGLEWGQDRATTWPGTGHGWYTVSAGLESSQDKGPGLEWGQDRATTWPGTRHGWYTVSAGLESSQDKARARVRTGPGQGHSLARDRTRPEQGQGRAGV